MIITFRRRLGPAVLAEQPNFLITRPTPPPPPTVRMCAAAATAAYTYGLNIIYYCAQVTKGFAGPRQLLQVDSCQTKRCLPPFLIYTFILLLRRYRHATRQTCELLSDALASIVGSYCNFYSFVDFSLSRKHIDVPR